tara:strand:+ start:82 stop:609 length:528 start_codon:yes stop_codon:yes gene_type:complete
MALHYRNINPNLIKLKLLKIKYLTKNYLNWLNDSEVTKHTDLIFQKHSFKSIKKYINNMNKDNNNFLYGIFYKNSHIGNVKIGPILKVHKSAYISYLIGEKKLWNKGIGKIIIKLTKNICKKKHKLIKLNAGVSELHKPSQLVLLKNGFKLEGNFKKQIVFKNKRYSLLKYGCIL